QHDDKTGHWHFADNVLQTAAKAGYVAGVGLQDPLDGKLTLHELMANEKHFYAEHLARAITKHRLEKLSAARVQYTNAHKAEWFNNGRWIFPVPGMVLINAARQQNLEDAWLRDAWGQAIKLVPANNQGSNRTGHALFDHYDLLSAGPDRDFE